MDKLIEKLEDAEAGSRELDGPIHRFLLNLPLRDPMDKAWPCEVTFCEEHLVPHYTTSLDAALTLVPEGAAIDDFQIWPGHLSSLTILGTRWQLFGGSETSYMAWVHNYPDCGRWPAEAATPELAVCIAALKARNA